jgi:hypothetical protein
MMHKVGRQLGPAAFGKVSWGGISHDAQLAQALCSQPGVRQLSDAHGQVEAFLQEINVAVGGEGSDA